jgi:2-iminobutanoate/2-iminopropanoate deaminase
MSRTLVSSDAIPPPAGPYSPALEVDGWVFLAGQGGTGDTIEQQTEAALANVAALLEAAGCSLDDVVSTLVHLSDLSDFQRYNAVYERHFSEPRPVRTTVGASLLGNMLVEITVVARRP